MNTWESFSFDDFMAYLDEVDQFAGALEAHEPPPRIRLRDEPIATTSARIRCFMRITDYIRHHAEAFWGAGLLQDREHFLGVQNRLWRAVHNYFTDASREADAVDPPVSDIIRIALADTR